MTAISPRARRALVAGLVCAAAAVVVVSTRRDPMQRLARAAASANVQVIDGRLRGFPRGRHGRFRGTATSSRATTARLIATAADIRSEAGSDANSRHAAAIAMLTLGEAANAVATLQGLAATSSSAAIWSDLSAAQLELSRISDDPRAAARALYAANRALQLDDRIVEARFNRALALQTIGASQLAAAEYGRYIQLDAASDWATDARQRRDLLELTLRETSWPDHEAVIRAAALRADVAEVRRRVTRVPQMARTSAETPWLAKWGELALAGKEREAREQLGVCRATSAALRESTGEMLLHDAVAAIDAAAAQGDRARLELLAAAHQKYDVARRVYGERKDIPEALRLLAESRDLFARAGSPMQFIAEHYVANATFDVNERDRAEQALLTLLDRVPEHYHALRAQTLWQLGTASGHRGLVHRSMTMYTQAMETFERLHERENATSCRIAIARLLGILGRTDELWRLRARIFSESGQTADARPLYSAIATAGLDAIREEEWQAAHALLSVTLELDVPRNALRHAQVLLALALASARAGESDAATSGMQRARLVASSVKGPAAEALAAEVLTTEAKLLAVQEPSHAATLLDAAIAEAARQRRALGVAELHLERARALDALRRDDAAIADLERAVALLEQQRDSGRSEPFVAREHEAFGELAVMLAARGDLERAFDVVERGRTRRLFGRADIAPLPLRDVQKALPERTLLAHVTTTRDRLLVLAITRTSAAALRLPQQATTTAAATAQAVVNALSDSLRNLQTLVVVPDDTVAAVPFAALVDRGTRRPLVERVSIVIAPSASRYATVSAATATPVVSSAVVVGDPQFDAARFRHLTRLPAAAAEAAEIARMYDDGRALTGRDATRSALVRELQTREVLHVATHAEVNGGDPLQSGLIFAPDGNSSGAVTVRDILQANPSALRLTMLAGCRTADAGRGRLAGSLAAAFLAAGSENVIGTLWDVEDSVSRELSISLHKLLRAGVAPAEALRRVQIQFIHSGEPRLAAPEAWSAFQLYGSGR